MRIPMANAMGIFVVVAFSCHKNGLLKLRYYVKI